MIVILALAVVFGLTPDHAGMSASYGEKMRILAMKGHPPTVHRRRAGRGG